eukprot:m.111191 g.111191  ORF g.111191 m.111191 type:complete len:563 (+) comp15945_c0_seq1:142-1830(+)
MAAVWRPQTTYRVPHVESTLTQVNAARTVRQNASSPIGISDIKWLDLIRTRRTKAVCFHPTRPWVLLTFHATEGIGVGGGLGSSSTPPKKSDATTMLPAFIVWNYETNCEVCVCQLLTASTLRAARFFRAPDSLSGGRMRELVLLGTDSCELFLVDLLTTKPLACGRWHKDYIRCIEIHAEDTFALSCSDDMNIYLSTWAEERDEFSLTLVAKLTGHAHYVMALASAPRDPESTTWTVASASLDRTVKIWDIEPHASTWACRATLVGHTHGVNTVTFMSPDLLASGADDRSILLWNLQTMACVFRSQQHTHNVSALFAAGDSLLSVGEDSFVFVWSHRMKGNTHRLALDSVIDTRKVVATDTPITEAEINTVRSNRAWAVSGVITDAAQPNRVLVGVCVDHGALFFNLTLPSAPRATVLTRSPKSWEASSNVPPERVTFLLPNGNTPPFINHMRCSWKDVGSCLFFSFAWPIMVPYMLIMSAIERRRAKTSYTQLPPPEVDNLESFVPASNSNNYNADTDMDTPASHATTTTSAGAGSLPSNSAMRQESAADHEEARLLDFE